MQQPQAQPANGVNLTEQTADFVASCEGIVYPPHISMEQCSSQFTAQYKSEIAQTLLTPAVTVRARMSDSAESDNQTTKSEPQLSDSGESDTQETKTGVRVTDSPESDTLVARSSMVDLTGGFGVDFSYLARGFSQATYVERQRHLCDLAEHNMAALGLDQARIVCDDGVEYLRQMDPVDFIYLDPARRDEHGSRTYAIEDCTPNVLELRDLLLAKSQCTLVKLSPMLDWRKAVADFDGTVREVHIVATGNECKELLLVLGQQVHEEPSAPRVFCVNDNQRIDYDSAAYTQGLRIGGKPLPETKNYLYEPNASIMKAGCFDLVEERFGVTQVGPSSHLFVSATPVADFPGRGFAIEAIGGMNKKDIKRLLNGTKQANIAVRNFPLTAPQLRKKLKLADGGPVYLFGTTMQGCDHVLLRTSKI